VKRKSFIFLSLVLIIMLSLLASCASADHDNSPQGADPGVGSGSEQGTEQSPQNTPPQDTTQEPGITVAQSDMWRVELHHAETAESLTATLAALQYGGDIIETTNDIIPESGNVFLLLELTIEKIGTGRAAFSWNDAHIIDDAGVIYFRHPNDTFLTNLNIPRLRGTDIVLGVEYGFVCFEVPKNATGLSLIADAGNIEMKVLP
jgi:hypothetical protein